MADDRMLTGIPPFEVPLPSRDTRCRVIAVEERLGELLEAWRMPVSPEVSQYGYGCRRDRPRELFRLS